MEDELQRFHPNVRKAFWQRAQRLNRICELSKNGEARVHIDGLNVATMFGPTTPDGLPREPKIALWNRKDIELPLHVERYACGASMWLHWYPIDVQEWFVTLDWKVVNPISGLEALAKQMWPDR